MKLLGFTFPWGIPFFVVRSKDSWAHQKGPFISLPEPMTNKDKDKPLYRHEVWHAKQWVITTLLPLTLSILLFIVFQTALFGFAILFTAIASHIIQSKTSYRREAAAYGEMVRAGFSLDHSAIILSGKHYGFQKSVEEVKKDILEYSENGKLF